MNSEQKPVALIIGASRGIGRQVAIDLAKNGYFVVVSAKSTTSPHVLAQLRSSNSFPPDPNSSDCTITTVALEITLAGNSSLALPCDVRNPQNIFDLVSEVTSRLGRIDVLIYNSGAIWWSAVETTPLKRFQLMQEVNPQGLYAAVQACLRVFKDQGWKGRIIVVSPPIYSRFFRGKTAYAMGKVGMSVLTKGLAMDFVRQNRTEMAITSIWPAVSIESAATESAVKAEQDVRNDLRKPTIYSDAILAMLEAPAKEVNGLLDTDEDFLRRVKGIEDFSRYNVVPEATPRRIMPQKFPVLEVEEQDDEGRRTDSVKMREKRENAKSKL